MQQKVEINRKLNQHLVYYIRRIMFAGHGSNHMIDQLAVMPDKRQPQMKLAFQRFVIIHFAD